MINYTSITLKTFPYDILINKLDYLPKINTMFDCYSGERTKGSSRELQQKDIALNYV